MNKIEAETEFSGILDWDWDNTGGSFEGLCEFASRSDREKKNEIIYDYIVSLGADPDDFGFRIFNGELIIK